jgi:Zn-dependent peptidase ImmA (M78 family)
MPVRRKHIQLLAEQLLRGHRIRSAPVPVEELATALGVPVVKEPTDDEISGFLFRDRAQKSAIIGVNAIHHPNRQNFTIAHELGHFLLHEGDEVHVDRGFQIKLRADFSRKGSDVEERESNLFAAEILMPASFLKNDLKEVHALRLDVDDAVEELASKYNVSTQAMLFRLANLGYIKL